MKKAAFLFTIVLLSTFTFAQKANVNKALSKAQAEENPDFDEAKALIESALVNDETKTQTKTWWTAGRVYELSSRSEQMKEGHESEAGADAMREYDLYLSAYEMDFQPNAKGKVKPQYDKKIKESMASLYKSNILVNYSVKKQDDKQYEEAFRIMKRHLDIIELEMIKSDPKMMADTLLQKRTQYAQLKFFAAIWAWQAKMFNEALSYLDDIKSSGYKQQEVYEYMAQICGDDLRDTVRYEAVLREGAQVVPQSQFLIGNLINLYVDRKQTNEAIEYLKQAINQTPTAQLYNVLGSVQETAGDLDNALINFNKALELDANYVDAIANIGRLYYNQGVKIEEESMDIKDAAKKKEMDVQKNAKILQALPYFEKAYELNMDDTLVQKMLRQTYYRLTQADPKFKMKYPELARGDF